VRNEDNARSDHEVPNPDLSSTEVEAVNIGPPETVPVEPDILQYQYDGHCPLCHVPLVGCFWVRRDQATAEEKPKA
jgi:hypothetical protein